MIMARGILACAGLSSPAEMHLRGFLFLPTPLEAGAPLPPAARLLPPLGDGRPRLPDGLDPAVRADVRGVRAGGGGRARGLHGGADRGRRRGRALARQGAASGPRLRAAGGRHRAVRARRPARDAAREPPAAGAARRDGRAGRGGRRGDGGLPPGRLVRGAAGPDGAHGRDAAAARALRGGARRADRRARGHAVHDQHGRRRARNAGRRLPAAAGDRPGPDRLGGHGAEPGGVRPRHPAVPVDRVRGRVRERLPAARPPLPAASPAGLERHLLHVRGAVDAPAHVRAGRERVRLLHHAGDVPGRHRARRGGRVADRHHLRQRTPGLRVRAMGHRRLLAGGLPLRRPRAGTGRPAVGHGRHPLRGRRAVRGDAAARRPLHRGHLPVRRPHPGRPRRPGRRRHRARLRLEHRRRRGGRGRGRAVAAARAPVRGDGARPGDREPAARPRDRPRRPPAPPPSRRHRRGHAARARAPSSAHAVGSAASLDAAGTHARLRRVLRGRTRRHGDRARPGRRVAPHLERAPGVGDRGARLASQPLRRRPLAVAARGGRPAGGAVDDGRGPGRRQDGRKRPPLGRGHRGDGARARGGARQPARSPAGAGATRSATRASACT